MPTALLRRPHDADAYDLDALRAWMQQRVYDQVRLRGTPEPAIHLVTEGHEVTLDLDDATRQDPEASVGATWMLLRQLPEFEAAFLVGNLRAELDDGDVLDAAMVACEDEEGLWVAILPYGRDAETGLGQPAEEWQVQVVQDVPEMLAELVRAPAGARPHRLLPPRAPVPDLQAAFGTLPEDVDLPASAEAFSELVAHMIVPAVVKEGLSATVVLRFAGRDWEWWVLGPDQPADLDEMVRVICYRDPPADGVAIVLIALFEGADPAQPGIQMVCETAGGRAERWVLLDLPEGLDGPRIPGRELLRSLPLPREGDRWLGEEPTLDIELYPLGAAEA